MPNNEDINTVTIDGQTYQSVQINRDDYPRYQMYNGSELVNCYSGVGNSHISGFDVHQQTYEYIKQYNYIPDIFNFHKIGNEEELYLGVELEIDSGGKIDKNAKMVIDFLGEQNVYCTHDGSLNNGFEITTHPCTYEYHSQLPYEDLFKKLVSLKYKSHDTQTCGLHVHFNRNYLGKSKLEQDLGIAKLTYLFEKCWDKITCIARRESCHYSSRFYIDKDDSILDMYAKSKNGDKYKTINLQHKNTVEIRIFKGTLNYNTFMLTLKFVKQMVYVAKNLSINEMEGITWENIYHMFDDDILEYIRVREEEKKKVEIKKKEEYDAMFSNHMNTSLYHSNCSESSIQMTNLDLSRAWSELIRGYTPQTSIDISQREVTGCFGNNEPSEEDNLKQRITELKRQLKRSHNGLEITNLNREISRLERDLARLRRNNRH